MFREDRSKHTDETTGQKYDFLIRYSYNGQKLNCVLDGAVPIMSLHTTNIYIRKKN